MTDPVARIRIEEDGLSSVDRALRALGQRFGRMGEEGSQAFSRIEREADAAADQLAQLRRRMMPPRDARGRWVATSQAFKEVRKEIAQLNADAAMDRYRLSSREYTRAAREAAQATRRLERASMTLGERFTESLETFENVEGVLGIVEMAVGAVVAAFEAAQLSAQFTDISASASAAAVNVEALAQSAAGLGNVSTAQAVRAVEMTNNGALMRALRQGTTGRATGISTGLMDEVAAAATRTGADPAQLIAGLQGDLGSGKAGAGFAALGADVDRVNLRMQDVRAEMLATAELIEGAGFVDPVAHSMALISGGLEEAQQTSRRFRDVTTESLKETAEIFNDIKAEIGSDVAGLFIDEGKLAELRTSMRQKATAAVTDFSNFMRTGASDIGAGQFEQVNDIVDQALRRSEEAAAIRENLAHAGRDDAEDLLKRMGLEKAINDEMADQLAAAVGLGEEAGKALQIIETVYDLEQLRERVQESQLLRERDRLALNANLAKEQAAQARTLKNDVLARQHEAAAAEFDRLHAASMMATTYEEIAGIKLSADVALMAERFRSTVGAASELRQELEASAGLAQQMMTLGRGAGDVLTSGLLDAIGTSLPGPDEKKKPKRSAGKRDDFADLFNQAALAGVEGTERELLRAQQELDKNVERVGENLDALDAAFTIYHARVDELMDAQRQQMLSTARGLGDTLLTALQTPLRAFDRVTDQIEQRTAEARESARARLDERAAGQRSRRNLDIATAQVRGDFAYEDTARDFASGVADIESRRDAELEATRATGALKLEIEQSYGEELVELREAMHERDMARLAESSAAFVQAYGDVGEAAMELGEREFEYSERTAEGLETRRKAWIDFGSAAEKSAFVTLRVMQKTTTASAKLTSEIGAMMADVAAKRRDAASASTEAAFLMVQAGAGIAASEIRNEKAAAAVKAIGQTAAAAAAFARGLGGDPLGFAAAAKHGFAAAQYGILAGISTPSTGGGGAGGGGGGGGTVGSSFGGGFDGGGVSGRSSGGGSGAPTLAPIGSGDNRPILIVNTHFSAETGETKVEVINESIARGRAEKIDGRGVSTRNRRSDYL